MKIEPQPRLARVVFAVALVVTSLPCACAKSSPPPEASAEKPVSSSSASASAGTTPSAATSGESEPTATGTAGLFERLAKEKGSRPTGTPRTDDVFAAFKKAGMPVVEENQVYAAMVKASYCEAAKGTTVYLSVCEYPSEAEAKTGQDFSKRTFASIPNRDVYLNKKTTLTIGQTTPTPKGNAEAKAMVDAFLKL